MSEKAKPAKAKGSTKWWIVQKHDVLELEEADTRPRYPDERGQRRTHVHGPYHDRATAQGRLDHLESRTLRVQAGR